MYTIAMPIVHWVHVTARWDQIHVLLYSLIYLLRGLLISF